MKVIILENSPNGQKYRRSLAAGAQAVATGNLFFRAIECEYTNEYTLTISDCFNMLILLTTSLYLKFSDNNEEDEEEIYRIEMLNFMLTHFEFTNQSMEEENDEAIGQNTNQYHTMHT